MLKRMAGLCGAVAILLILARLGNGQTEQLALVNSIKATLIFEKSPKWPSTLRVYLRLVSLGDGMVTWSADPAMGIEAELLDPDGKPAAMPPEGMNLSILSSPYALTLPGNSRLDVLISQDWGGGIRDPKGGYTLALANHVWFIPRDAAEHYTLHIRFPGVFGSRSKKPKLLFDILPQKIIISPSPS
jgi:hypothetical protein